MADFDLDRLKEIPDPYEAIASSQPRPLPKLPSRGLGRGSLRRRRRTVLLAVLGVQVAWLLLAGVAARVELPAWFAIEAFVLPVAGAVLAWYAATLPGRLGLGLPVRQLSAALAATFVLFGLSVPFAPGSSTDEFTLRSTVLCAVTSTLLAGLPFAAGFVLFRRGFAGNAGLRMALFGGACGSIAAALVRVHCPKDSVAHILIGHGVAILLFSLLGAKVGRESVRV